jgi:hypothetical protein
MRRSKMSEYNFYLENGEIVSYEADNYLDALDHVRKNYHLEEIGEHTEFSITPEFVQDITKDYGIGIVMINEPISETGIGFSMYYGTPSCELQGEGECADDGIVWMAQDMGSPDFCTNHYFPQEQTGYEFYMDTIESLTTEYDKWTNDNGLPVLSADELIVQTKEDSDELIINDEQKWYLQSFIQRWDEAQELEAAK